MFLDMHNGIRKTKGKSVRELVIEESGSFFDEEVGESKTEEETRDEGNRGS